MRAGRPRRRGRERERKDREKRKGKEDGERDEVELQRSEDTRVKTYTDNKQVFQLSPILYYHVK